MKVGFIGTGKIGTALVKGLLHAGIAGQEIFVYAGGHESARQLAAQNDLQVVNDYAEFATCQAVVVAVGGPIIETIIKELGQRYHGIILSTGGGDLTKVNQDLPAGSSFVKIVPNTPVQIGEGITAVSFVPNEQAEVVEPVKAILALLGEVYIVPEKLLGIYGTVAGCAPAYVDLMIEALSDAAVQNGVNRAESYPLIEKMLLGTAKLALAEHKLPEELKDEVTTPGGSTIRGVVKLEEMNFRNALIQAINASAK
ncbi:pyrroline-5-carboxylate reductase family protein [Lactobacillus xylocopicola]|uniref:Pyrroline-5-carboxylate reductase n=1 Tax=Lactobacillus xylocopicola TaxID=2976676 RepID=A0ABN6SLB7_9LACO|nr:pyrroline-5-carboxylate reductase [Lactobacillus xylocopicola]BDR59806.1 pyrroline-5-carboxylate reductase [Lactobacillus xylocopicola]